MNFSKLNKPFLIKLFIAMIVIGTVAILVEPRISVATSVRKILILAGYNLIFLGLCFSGVLWASAKTYKKWQKTKWGLIMSLIGLSTGYYASLVMASSRIWIFVFCLSIAAVIVGFMPFVFLYLAEWEKRRR